MRPDDFFKSKEELEPRLMVVPTDTSSLACRLNLFMIKVACGNEFNTRSGRRIRKGQDKTWFLRELLVLSKGNYTLIRSI